MVLQGEGGCIVAEVTDSQSDYDLISPTQIVNMSSTAVLSAGEPDPKQLVSLGGKRHDSCHLANPQGGRDKEFSCRTGTVLQGEEGCTIAEVIEPQSDYELNS